MVKSFSSHVIITHSDTAHIIFPMVCPGVRCHTLSHHPISSLLLAALPGVLDAWHVAVEQFCFCPEVAACGEPGSRTVFWFSGGPSCVGIGTPITQSHFASSTSLQLNARLLVQAFDPILSEKAFDLILSQAAGTQEFHKQQGKGQPVGATDWLTAHKVIKPATTISKQKTKVELPQGWRHQSWQFHRSCECANIWNVIVQRKRCISRAQRLRKGCRYLPVISGILPSSLFEGFAAPTQSPYMEQLKSAKDRFSTPPEPCSTRFPPCHHQSFSSFELTSYVAEIPGQTVRVIFPQATPAEVSDAQPDYHGVSKSFVWGTTVTIRCSTAVSSKSMSSACSQMMSNVRQMIEHWNKDWIWLNCTLLLSRPSVCVPSKRKHMALLQLELGNATQQTHTIITKYIKTYPNCWQLKPQVESEHEACPQHPPASYQVWYRGECSRASRTEQVF